MPIFPPHPNSLKRAGLIILTILLVAGGSFWQERVLEVQAQVQVLLVSRTAIAFGDVFPGENNSQTYTVQLDTSANSATYATALNPIAGLQNLCPFLNVYSIDSPPEPDTLANATLKRPGDVLDNWRVQFNVPGIQGQLSQNHQGGIIVQGGNFGCQITITTASDPGTIIICKQSVGGAGAFNFTGDLGNFSIQTVSSNNSQSNPCGNPSPCVSGSNDQTSGSNSPIQSTTKCITTTTVTNTNNSTVVNISGSTSGSGGNSITASNGNVNNGVIISGDSVSNSSVNNTVNTINSTVNIGSASGGQTFSNLQPGTYNVTESSSTNWTLTSLVCQDPGKNTTISQTTAGIVLDSGETVVCTFTNTLKPKGKIIIHKKTGSDSDACNFSGGLGNFNVPTVQGLGQQEFDNLDPGIYNVSENAKGSWSPSSVSCSGGSAVTSQNSAKITLAGGQTITCTFTDISKK